MVYNPEVTIKVSYGCYQWYSSSGGTEQSVIICPGMEKECSCMVRVSLPLSNDLFAETNIIEIHDETGFLAQYTTKPLESNLVNLLFKPKYVKFGTFFDVRCRKVASLGPPMEAGGLLTRCGVAGGGPT